MLLTFESGSSGFLFGSWADARVECLGGRVSVGVSNLSDHELMLSSRAPGGWTSPWALWLVVVSVEMHCGVSDSAPRQLKIFGVLVGVP